MDAGGRLLLAGRCVARGSRDGAGSEGSGRCSLALRLGRFLQSGLQRWEG